MSDITLVTPPGSSRTWDQVVGGSHPESTLKDGFNLNSARFIALGIAHGEYNAEPTSIKEAAHALTAAGHRPNVARRLDYSGNTTTASPHSTSSSTGETPGDISESPAHNHKRIRLSKNKSATGVIAPTSAQLAQNGAGEARWRTVGGANQFFLWREEVTDGWTDHQGRPFEPQIDQNTGELIKLDTVYPYRGSQEQTAKRKDLLAKLVHRSCANQYGVKGDTASSHRDFHIGRPESHQCKPASQFTSERKKGLSAENKARVEALEDKIEHLDACVARQALIFHESLEVVDDHINELSAIAVIAASCTRASDIKAGIGAILGIDCSSAEGVRHLPVDDCHEGLDELVATAIAKGDVSAIDLKYQRDRRVKETLAGLLDYAERPDLPYISQLAQANFGLLQDDQRDAYRTALKHIAPAIPSGPTAVRRPDIAPQELALAKDSIEQNRALESAIKTNDAELAKVKEQLRIAQQNSKKKKNQFKNRRPNRNGRQRWQQEPGNAAPANQPDESEEAEGSGRGRGRGRGGRGRARGRGRGRAGRRIHRGGFTGRAAPRGKIRDWAQRSGKKAFKAVKHFIISPAEMGNRLGQNKEPVRGRLPPALPRDVILPPIV